MRLIGRVLATFALAASIVTVSATPVQARVVDFTLGELLGKPTDSSVTVNFEPGETINVFVEYGTAPGVYTGTTTTVVAPGGSPTEISGLSGNTQYYYRLVYETTDDLGNFETRPEHSFWTQRASGSTFTFVLQSDSHIQGGPSINTTTYANTISNMVADGPDFLIDVGDMFEVRTNANTTAGFYAQQRGFMALRESVGCESAGFGGVIMSRAVRGRRSCWGW